MEKQYISYQTAYRLTMDHISPLPRDTISVLDCEGFVAAEDVYADVDSPSINMSLKDGYAVHSKDLHGMTRRTPVKLHLTGTIAAGEKHTYRLKNGCAFRILTGAKLPEQSDTVVAEEFTTRAGESKGSVTINEPTNKGKNILVKGSDSQKNELIVKAGAILTPAKAGLIAAGGHERIAVYRKPKVAVIATGDEVLLPGMSFSEGKLYASNLITLNAWCQRYGYETAVDVAGDELSSLKASISRIMETQDVLITSGGAWSGDKDLMARALSELGWEKHYHRVKLGPGKAAGFGLLNQKPVFLLPGGPPSNLAAFLTLALPGLFRLSGICDCRLTVISAMITRAVTGQSDWTQVIYGNMECRNEEIQFIPEVKRASRLRSMAEADALLLIPEGVSKIDSRSQVVIQLLS